MGYQQPGGEGIIKEPVGKREKQASKRIVLIDCLEGMQKKKHTEQKMANKTFQLRVV